MVKSTLYLQIQPDRRVRRAAPDAGASSSPELDFGCSLNAVAVPSSYSITVLRGSQLAKWPYLAVVKV